eukprot:scaffold201785_cov29-Tisochrysis_lutea.AAC.4
MATIGWMRIVGPSIVLSIPFVVTTVIRWAPVVMSERWPRHVAMVVVIVRRRSRRPVVKAM